MLRLFLIPRNDHDTIVCIWINIEFYHGDGLFLVLCNSKIKGDNNMNWCVCPGNS